MDCVRADVHPEIFDGLRRLRYLSFVRKVQDVLPLPVELRVGRSPNLQDILEAAGLGIRTSRQVIERQGLLAASDGLRRLSMEGAFTLPCSFMTVAPTALLQGEPEHTPPIVAVAGRDLVAGRRSAAKQDGVCTLIPLPV